MKAARSLVVLAIATACSRGDATAPPVGQVPPGSQREAEPIAAPDPEPASAPEPESVATDEIPAEPPVEPTSPPSRPIDDAKGMATEALVAAHGEPDEKKGERWIYRYPRDGSCVDREIVYTLKVKNGTIADVQRSTRQTGQHCAPTDMP